MRFLLGVCSWCHFILVVGHFDSRVGGCMHAVMIYLSELVSRHYISYHSGDNKKYIIFCDIWLVEI